MDNPSAVGEEYKIACRFEAEDKTAALVESHSTEDCMEEVQTVAGKTETSAEDGQAGQTAEAEQAGQTAEEELAGQIAGNLIEHYD